MDDTAWSDTQCTENLNCEEFGYDFFECPIENGQERKCGSPYAGPGEACDIGIDDLVWNSNREIDPMNWTEFECTSTTACLSRSLCQRIPSLGSTADHPLHALSSLFPKTFGRVPGCRYHPL